MTRIIEMSMPPLTPPDRPLYPAFWRLLLLVACVLVFSFALHAKVAVYGQSQPQPSTASKLWANGVKVETLATSPTSLVLWLAVFLASVLCESQSSHHYVSPIAAREWSRHPYLHRFLRPPPSN